MLKFLSDKTKDAAANEIEMLIVTCTRHHHALMQSPIEEMLFEAIVTQQFLQNLRLPMIGEASGSRASDGPWKITPQASVKKFRVDFVIEDQDHPGLKVAVECDGHDFHERTKQQAQKDRSRDRELQALGYLVLRYTGSEIWRDPYKCAEDIQSKIWATVSQQFDSSEPSST